ncbi:MAG: sulfatase, partial [Gemmatimonadetes bacterium]|nr:sulfatase [Gemmatimonadota bacterium]
MRSTSLFLTVLAGSILFGVASGVGEVNAQSYASLGFWRNALLVVRESTLRITGYGVLFAAAVAIAHAFLARQGRSAHHRPRAKDSRGERPVALSLALVSALSILCVRGYLANRYDLRLSWVTKSERFGGHFPDALFDGAVWRTNAAIALGALAIGLAIYALPLLITRAAPGRSLLRAGAGLLGPLRFAACGLLIATTALPSVLFRVKPDGPSVVWISLDTLRADFLSGYGYKDETSPALDAFASRCVVFERAYSQAPSTLPSHSSFLTSRYPTVNLVTEETKRLPPWRVLAMEIFREAGYRTAGIVDTPFLTAKYGLEQGYDDFVPRGNRALSIIPQAKEWLARHQDEPYFLFLHMYDIHSPYARDPKYKEMFLDFDYTGDIDPARGHLGLFRRKLDRGAGQGYEISDDDARYLKTIYAGGLRRADDILAEFLTYLLNDLPAGTLLIITSDHGEEFMEH